MEKHRTVFALLIALVMAAPVMAWAEDAAPSADAASTETDAGETALDEEATTPAGAARVTQRLADEFNVETSQVEALRDQQMGYGEIHHALSLANQLPGGVTQENVDSVMAMRQEQRMGWGQIAHELDTNLGAVTRRGGEAGSTTTGTTTGAESVTRQGSRTHTGLGTGRASVGIHGASPLQGTGAASAGHGSGADQKGGGHGLGHAGGGGAGGASSHGHGHQ